VLYEQARQAAQALDYDRALTRARAALEAGDGLPDDAWRIHGLMGEMAASIGLASLSRAHVSVEDGTAIAEM
jgi:hypothetical protein